MKLPAVLGKEGDTWQVLFPEEYARMLDNPRSTDFLPSQMKDKVNSSIYFFFPAKAWLVLTPFLPLGAAIQPSLDLEVIPINIYENFMIKEESALSSSRHAPTHITWPQKPVLPGRSSHLVLGSLRMHTPKLAGALQGQFTLLDPVHGINSAFLPFPSP